MSVYNEPTPMISQKSKNLRGTALIPSDKSISHRSLILGAMCVGRTRITGLLEGQDVLDTARAMESFGAHVERGSDGVWLVDGVGVGGFSEPNRAIDCGNSGTGVRLMMGSMATSPITATFLGDESLSKRPMARVTDPLRLFGTQCYGRAGPKLPLTIVGAENPIPIRYTVPVPSAQVKSAILLAGLNSPGQTMVTEQEATRDHTERMLKGFGAVINIEKNQNGTAIILDGQPELKCQSIVVPRDPSSAAFPVCAALIVEGSDIIVPNIGLNPTRVGLFKTLREMGANLDYQNIHEEGGEPVADLRVQFSNLNGVEVPAERAASMIDEYPILAVVASFANGKTIMRGIKELRVKESDRIDAMARGLSQCGVHVEQDIDFMVIHGRGPDGVMGGSTCQTFLDHRIAMAFLCMGLATKKPIEIDDYGPIMTSFPNFQGLMVGLGANLNISKTP